MFCLLLPGKECRKKECLSEDLRIPRAAGEVIKRKAFDYFHGNIFMTMLSLLWSERERERESKRLYNNDFNQNKQTKEQPNPQNSMCLNFGFICLEAVSLLTEVPRPPVSQLISLRPVSPEFPVLGIDILFQETVLACWLLSCYTPHPPFSFLLLLEMSVSHGGCSSVGWKPKPTSLYWY